MKTHSYAFIASLVSLVLLAYSPLYAEVTPKWVLADLELLKESAIKPAEESSDLGIGLAQIYPLQEQQLSRNAHKKNRCGGFEVIPAPSRSRPALSHLLKEIRKTTHVASSNPVQILKKNEIENAINEVSEENLKNWVSWFSSFSTRNHRSPDANKHVTQLKNKITELLKNSSIPYQIDLVDHRATIQKSIRVRLPGKTATDEIIILGAHMDSINQMDFIGFNKAPGADDNASGSSNLLEALRILSQKDQLDRTIEFFWYAGEEGGLLGSSEIAKDYKTANKKVIAVLQLDMTMFPGSGEFVLGSMTDFTDTALRQYFYELNKIYVGARVVEDQCGYACSDHASWFRQGYATLMPFEAAFNDMNRKLHTENDLISSNTSFRHAAMFSKFALAIAMDLGTSHTRF